MNPDPGAVSDPVLPKEVQALAVSHQGQGTVLGSAVGQLSASGSCAVEKMGGALGIHTSFLSQAIQQTDPGMGGGGLPKVTQ